MEGGAEEGGRGAGTSRCARSRVVRGAAGQAGRGGRVVAEVHPVSWSYVEAGGCRLHATSVARACQSAKYGRVTQVVRAARAARASGVVSGMLTVTG